MFHGRDRLVLRQVRAAALTLACLGILAAPAFASARVSARTHVASCNSHRPHALKATRRVLVWSKPTGTDPESDGRLSTLYACLRPAGHSVAIGQNAAAGPEYPGNVATSHLSVTGTLVSDLVITGLTDQAGCGKYDPGSPACATAARETARVFNLASRRSLRQPLAGAAVAYAFSATGAIAWEAPTSPGTAGSALMLQAVGFDPSGLAKGAVQTLDTGDLSTSLRFAGLTLEWSNAGQPKSALLTTTS